MWLSAQSREWALAPAPELFAIQPHGRGTLTHSGEEDGAHLKSPAHASPLEHSTSWRWHRGVAHYERGGHPTVTTLTIGIVDALFPAPIVTSMAFCQFCPAL